MNSTTTPVTSHELTRLSTRAAADLITVLVELTGSDWSEDDTLTDADRRLEEVLHELYPHLVAAQKELGRCGIRPRGTVTHGMAIRTAAELLDRCDLATVGHRLEDGAGKVYDPVELFPHLRTKGGDETCPLCGGERDAQIDFVLGKFVPGLWRCGDCGNSRKEAAKVMKARRKPAAG